MKKSLSKQNTITQSEIKPQTQNTLHKTTKVTSQTDVQNPRPSSGRKIQTSKNLPPKLPKQKIQYVEADNMTISRIQQARNGLQLLKKKLSQKGLSRQKNKIQSIEKVQTPILTKGSSGHSQSNQSKIPNKVQSKNTIPQNNTKNDANIKNDVKKIQTSSLKNQTYNTQEYINEAEEIQIKPKQDFYKILQRQMRKQNTNNSNKGNFKAYEKQAQDNDDQLLQCSKGCGRMFNSAALPKHQKICQKVFQSKRKVFDSAQHRVLEEQGFKKPAQIPIKNKKASKQQQKPQSKVPKWKLQSAAFRARLKAINGNSKPLTAEEKAFAEMQKDLLVLCNFCGRRFNDKAAQRHIPFCQKKSKQIPKMNTLMPKKK